MSYEFFIAKRYLRSKRKSKYLSVITLISICGVLIGVAALTFVLSMMNGFEKEVRSRIIGITAHVSILSSEGVVIENYQELLPSIESHPQVRGIAPFVYFKAAIASKEESDGIVIRGIDPEKERKVTDIEKDLIAGAFKLKETEDEYPGIVLGVTLADRLRVKLGDEVILFSINKETVSAGFLAPKVTKFSVAGIFETGMYEYDANLAYISIPSAQKILNSGPVVTGLQIKTSDFYDASKVAKELDSKLGPDYYATDWMHMHKNLFSWMALEKYAMFIVLSLIVTVAAFNIISTLIMVVMEKRKEIGILKSIGATSSSIMKIFMFEGLVAGVVGTILGSFLGFILCWIQKTFKIVSLPPEIYFIATLPIDMRFFDFLIVALAALGITFLATLYPASRAAQMLPVEAIRYE
jgi:lipoprotein-releasing system permease protein